MSKAEDQVKPGKEVFVDAQAVVQEYLKQCFRRAVATASFVKILNVNCDSWVKRGGARPISAPKRLAR